jgi:ribose 5-phosphate isomerase B
MKIAIGADHGGFHLKQEIISFLKNNCHAVTDVGAHNDKPSDYPDFALAVADQIIRKKAVRGIIVCGSGVGACIAANKVPGIRASVCHDTFSARQGVEDDDMNVLCIGARIIGSNLAEEIVTVFLKARFSKLERHKRRLNKVREIERKFSRSGHTPTP